MLSHHVLIYAIDRAIKQFILKVAGCAAVLGLVVWIFNR